jgi:hypothetical protein
MTVSDGATLPLDGTIDNAGTIAINSTGDVTEIQITGSGATLVGGGQVTLSGGAAEIIGTNAADVLINVDNTISGAGQIGAGDGALTLTNEGQGTIEANVANATLALNMGAVINNSGVLEATNAGTLLVADTVSNSGTLEAIGGTLHFESSVINSGAGGAVIGGGTLEFDAAVNVNVTFANGQAGTNYGELVLKDASQFTGEITGFTGTAANASSSDVIDLVGINYNSAGFAENYNSTTGVLTVTDGANDVSLTFVDFSGTFKFASDGNGGTDIFDPPAANSRNSSVEISPSSSDQFIFRPGLLSETTSHFDSHRDSIEFDQFSKVESMQQTSAPMTPDVHGVGFVDFWHEHSSTAAGWTAVQFHQFLQGAVHLH